MAVNSSRAKQQAVIDAAIQVVREWRAYMADDGLLYMPETAQDAMLTLDGAVEAAGLIGADRDEEER